MGVRLVLGVGWAGGVVLGGLGELGGGGCMAKKKR